MELIIKYFPDLTGRQKEQFAALYDLYADWNAKINVVSRKDFDQLYLRHVLHSLAIAKVCTFGDGARQLIAAAAVVALHLWKKNTLLSIGVGTVLYMLLIRI